MSFNKKFLTVPAILAAICVASGGLIGAIHFDTSAYQAAHKSTEAPKEIKALYTDASYTFGEVEGFTPVSSTEANFRVTITACYTVLKGGEKVGLAYMVDCGKPVNTEVLMAISYHGEPGDALVPTAINLYQGGDSGYDTKAASVVDKILKGDTDLDKIDVKNGATRSSKAVIDGVSATMRDYKVRYAGGSVPTDAFPAQIRTMYPDVVDAVKDKTFTEIPFDTAQKENAGSVKERYLVTLPGDATAYAYYATGMATNIDFEGTDGELKLFFGWDSPVGESTTLESLRPSKFALEESSMSFDQWKDVYIPGILDGSKSLDSDTDIKTGATFASDIVRQMLLVEREDYYNVRLYGEQLTAFSSMFGAFTWDKASSAVNKSFALTSPNRSGKVDEQYILSVNNEEVVVYHGSGECEIWIDDYEFHNGKAALYMAFKGASAGAELSTIAPCAFFVSDVEEMAFDQWQNDYLPGIVDGSKSMDSKTDIVTGATYSSRLMQDLLVNAREAYVEYLATK